MDLMEFNAKRVTRGYRQKIDAPPENVFPLLCPVREAEWLDGWHFRMIHSESGLVEDGAVFCTPQAEESDTVWIVTRHDAAQHKVEFARFTPGSRICVLRIAVTAADGNASFVDISYTYTGLTDAGNEFVAGFTEEKFLDAMRFWERSMNHFLATGQKLRKE